MFKLPRIAQQRLESAALGEPVSLSGNPPHPDANLLTAFVERSLAASDHDQILLHLALCADCREVVALSMPSVGDLELAAVKPFQAGWMQWKFLRFGAGAALAAMLVGALLFTRVERRVDNTQVAQSTVPSNGTVAKSNTPAVTPPAAQSDSAPEATPKAAGTVQASKKAELSGLPAFKDDNSNTGFAASARKGAGIGGGSSTQTLAGISSRSKSGDSAPGALIRDRHTNDQIAAASQSTSRPATFSRQQQASGPGARQTPAANPASASPDVTSASAMADRAGKRAESTPADSYAAVQSLPLEREADATRSIDEARRADESSLKKKTAASVLSAKSLPPLGEAVPGAMVNPNPVFRASVAKDSDGSESKANTWRISNGRLQRWAAKRWKDVDLGIAIKFRTVVVSGKDVWAGGDAGTLLHSDNNGSDWDQVKGEWTGNIVAIRFTSPERGEIETSNHEKWATADNGATWRKLR